MFASGGGYNSDRVVREQTGALANSLKSLGEARPYRPFGGAGSAPPSGRPAELFARGTDWFVASVLAQQGIMNGFLSAIGDGSLAGYAAGAPTAVGSSATTSLVSAIEAMAYVPDSIRSSFEATWADPGVDRSDTAGASRPRCAGQLSRCEPGRAMDSTRRSRRRTGALRGRRACRVFEPVRIC